MRAADGTVTSFDPAGSTGTNAYSINKGGAIAGSYKDDGGTYRGFMRAPDGTITAVAVDGFETFAQGIDDRNRITGSYIKDGTRILGFERRSDGTMSMLKVPGSLYTDPESIGSAGGWITGSWSADQPGSHGFLRSP
jgi:uncharacterized membrane protein